MVPAFFLSKRFNGKYNSKKPSIYLRALRDFVVNPKV